MVLMTQNRGGGCPDGMNKTQEVCYFQLSCRLEDITPIITAMMVLQAVRDLNGAML
jgi:hypothetical protein